MLGSWIKKWEESHLVQTAFPALVLSSAHPSITVLGLVMHALSFIIYVGSEHFKQILVGIIGSFKMH